MNATTPAPNLAPNPAPAPAAASTSVAANTVISKTAYGAVWDRSRNADTNKAAIIQKISENMKKAGKTPEQIAQAVNNAYSAVKANDGDTDAIIQDRVAAAAVTALTTPAVASGAAPEGEAAGSGSGISKYLGGGIGALIGAVIAYFVGNTFFGGGFMGMFLTVAMGAAGYMLGKDKIGSWLGGKMGDDKSGDQQSAGRGRGGHAQARVVGEVDGADVRAAVAQTGNTKQVALKWNENFSQLVASGVKQGDDVSGATDISNLDLNCTKFQVVLNAEDKGVMSCMAPPATGGRQVARR